MTVVKKVNQIFLANVPKAPPPSPITALFDCERRPSLVKTKGRFTLQTHDPLNRNRLSSVGSHEEGESDTKDRLPEQTSLDTVQTPPVRIHGIWNFEKCNLELVEGSSYVGYNCRTVVTRVKRTAKNTLDQFTVTSCEEQRGE